MTIDRRQFLEVCGALGISLALPGCEGGPRPREGAVPEVIIIGAGAAGLSAGYLLQQQGIPFKILEAGPTYGGRIKQTTTFTDFAIPLGGEWLHTDESALTRIVNDETRPVEDEVETLLYPFNEKVAVAINGETTMVPMGFHEDRKFVGTTWLSFFDEYIVPSIREHIEFGVQIATIDSSGERVHLVDHEGNTRTAPQVIVTVPLQILQDRDIEFVPPLAKSKQEAIDACTVWGGIKVFLEFTEKFYPAFLIFMDSDTPTGQRLYFDASYGQKTESNILGLFAVGHQAKQYQTRKGDERLKLILEELDPIFSGKPSETYVKHIAQDWNEEPFIRCAYLADSSSDNAFDEISRAIDEKVYFAGEAYSRDGDWGAVHNAAQSARAAVDELLAIRKSP